jgi:hypothetical protein
MRKALKIGLVLAFVTTVLLVGATGGAMAGECMSIGDVTVNCGCDSMCY